MQPNIGDKIQNEFEPRGLRRGGVLFLTPDVAIEMVRRCREKNIEILGTDTFHLLKDATHPLIGETVDYTSGPDSKDRTIDRWSHAESFLRERLESGLQFEVVCG